MMKIITPRLLIREVTEDDDKHILKAAECPEINGMHSNEFAKLANVQRYIKVLLNEYKAGNFRTLCIANKHTNELIGMVTLDVDKVFPRAEISYWIRIEYRNKGYATEAVKAMIEYGFDTLSLNRIQGMHFTNNPASGRVLEKAGMVYEGTLRQYIGMNGVFYDCRMYSILRSDRIQ
jgi:ribosomal-protein-alanine N-acetyltransferase